jgi:hypothetical protein
MRRHFGTAGVLIGMSLIATFTPAEPPGPKPDARPPITTTLRGKAADSAGRVYRVDLEVTSSVTGGPPYVVRYSFVNRGSTPLALRKDSPDWKSGVRLVWESADGPAYEQALKAARLDLVAADEKTAAVTTKGSRLGVSRKYLKVKVGEDTLCSIVAPAYKTEE